MTSVVGATLTDYVQAHTSAEPDDVAAIREASATMPGAEMLIGPVEGALLGFLVGALRPRKVLEVGTFSGYSASFILGNLREGAALITCERDADRAEIARRHLGAIGSAGSWEVRTGLFPACLSGADGPFSMIVLDGDLPTVDLYEAALEMLDDDGVMLIDNTLWRGRVVAPSETDKARAVAELNRVIRADERVECVLLTVRDGLTLVRRSRQCVGERPWRGVA